MYTHLGPLPLSSPLPKMGEGEARQGFPAPLLPFWEKGLGDVELALPVREAFRRKGWANSQNWDALALTPDS